MIHLSWYVGSTDTCTNPDKTITSHVGVQRVEVCIFLGGLMTLPCLTVVQGMRCPLKDCSMTAYPSAEWLTGLPFQHCRAH